MLVGIGLIILLISQSRSAYLALAVGFLVLTLGKNHLSITNSKFIKFSWIILTVLFIIAGIDKTTVFSRLYFLQALYGLIQHPLGVGIGNFSNLSNHSIINKFDGVTIVSQFTHDIALEILVGLGLFSTPFLIWLFEISVKLLKNLKQGASVYTAMFFALFANFLFIYTYFNPTMFWLWFISLGLAQSEIDNKKTINP